MLLLLTLIACCGLPGIAPSTPPSPVTVAAYEAKVWPPEGYRQRETIRFTTVGAPKGLSLGPAPIDVPRRLVGEGISTIEVVMKSGEVPPVSVGGRPFVVTATGAPGIQMVLDPPVAGPIQLGAGTGQVERIEVSYQLPDSRDPADRYLPDSRLSPTSSATLVFSSSRDPGLLAEVVLMWEGAAVDAEVRQRGLAGELPIGVVRTEGTSRLRVESAQADATALIIQPRSEGARLVEAWLYFHDPDPLDVGVMLGQTLAAGERLKLAMPADKLGKPLGRVEVSWDGAGVASRLYVGGVLVGQREPEAVTSPGETTARQVTRFAWLRGLPAGDVEIEVLGAATVSRLDAGLVLPARVALPTQ